MKRTFILLAAACLCSLPQSIAAQDANVLVPSELELTEEQRADLQKKVTQELVSVVKKCVGKYPRPEFFAALAVDFELKKSGMLRGSYVPAGVVDAAMYVKSDEEKAKLEEAGSLQRLVVRNDRDMERCFQKGMREFDSGLNRYSAKVSAAYSIAWEGSKPTFTATTFEVTKK